MAHRCPDGTISKLTRTGPTGTIEGVTFQCPRCGLTKSGAAIVADFEAVRPFIIAALQRQPLI